MACIEIPDVAGFKPVTDDYSAGFANGVEAVRDWLKSLPVSVVPSPMNAADILDDMIELRRNA